ncbi:DUF1648 domain-containing protein [Virgibacillus sp. DJP39]|uniref:DUF1648 domain-containing protein n=1 Tax=Virgibacillus sp. DJP39 TaxID=3409790 RepID=UPI003BB651FA
MGTLIYLIILYPTLPERIPTHFNLAGEADGWGGKKTIFILPLVASFMFIGLYLISKAPRTFNLPVSITEENAIRIYPVAQFYMTLFNLETVLILCCLVYVSLPNILSPSIYFLPIMILVYLITLILFVVKVKN